MNACLHPPSVPLILPASNLPDRFDPPSQHQDINNDGAADILIGAYRADPEGSMSGEVYVIFGSLSWTSEIVDLSNLGAGGLTFQGGARREYTGYSVAGAGGAWFFLSRARASAFCSACALVSEVGSRYTLRNFTVSPLSRADVAPAIRRIRASISWPYEAALDGGAWAIINQADGHSRGGHSEQGKAHGRGALAEQPRKGVVATATQFELNLR